MKEKKQLRKLTFNKKKEEKNEGTICYCWKISWTMDNEHFWDIFCTYLGHIQDISRTYLGLLWDILLTNLGISWAYHG